MVDEAEKQGRVQDNKEDSGEKTAAEAGETLRHEFFQATQPERTSSGSADNKQSTLEQTSSSSGTATDYLGKLEIGDHAKDNADEKQAQNKNDAKDNDGDKTPELRVDEKQALKELQEKIKQETEAGNFSGTVLIYKDGKPIFSDASGMADKEKGCPVDLDTKFRFGSMGKMFTATAILQLVQSGKIDLKDTLDKYLPDPPPSKDITSKVTIHQLLTHTGGTGDIFGPEFDKNRENLKSIDDFLKLYGDRTTEFEPGSKWQYSNFGYMLLGKVIEKASGQSYNDYLKEKIFKPAGMESTGLEPESSKVPGLSPGYMKDADGKWISNKDTLPYSGSPAGGGYSTAADFMKFAQSLLDNKLLDAEHFELLTRGKVSLGEHSDPNAKYAYGFFDDARNGDRVIGHSGGAQGMNGDLAISTKTGYTVVVLSNLDPPAANDISDFAKKRLMGQR